MDLGATASIFAVVSLAGQLGGGVSNLLTFFESFKGAPEYVRGIEKDLKLLLPILEGISFDDEPRYNDILQDCSAKIHNLQDIVDQLEPGFASSRRRIREWTALKTTRKASQIRKFKAVLEEMKSNLIIAILSKQLSRYIVHSGSCLRNPVEVDGFALLMFVLGCVNFEVVVIQFVQYPSPTGFWCLSETNYVSECLSATIMCSWSGC
jgi:Fungal N-terminal domain of STAND proteins